MTSSHTFPTEDPTSDPLLFPLETSEHTSRSRQLVWSENTKSFLPSPAELGLKSNFNTPLRSRSNKTRTLKDKIFHGGHGSEDSYLSSPRKTRSCTSRLEPQVLRAICFSLHVGIVLLHCILLGVSFPHWEHNKIIPLGFRSTAWAIALPALSQAFITIYSAAMLVVTQQLSLRRNLLVRQTLTATHDNSMAWNGLGSALLSLWRQVSVTASVWGVFSIAFYLAGISVLHVSTPSLLTLEAFNNTIQTNLSTTRALPNQDVDTSDSITGVFDYFTQAAPILPLIGQYSQLSTVGLSGNTIYDVLPENLGAGTVTVNSTTFDVSCDILPNPRISGNGSTHWNITADPLVDTEMGTVKSDFQASSIAPNVVRMALRQLDGILLDGGNRVLFYSSVPFTDSQGGNGSRVTLSPLLGRDTVNIKLREANQISSFQVMACRFSSRNGTMLVDAQTRFLMEPPPQKTSSTWGAPQPPQIYFPNSTELFTIQSWQDALSEASTVLGTTSAIACSDNCELLTALEQFVLQQLGIKPEIDPVNAPQPRPQLELYQLENALANMTAALQWSTTQMNPGNLSGSTLYDMAFAGQATVSQPELASRLKLNKLPISIGLGTSITLLIIAVMLVGNLEGKGEAVDNAGILQLIWLIRDHPDIQGRISDVETPSADHLRAAGMFLVRLAEDKDTSDRYPLRSKGARMEEDL